MSDSISKSPTSGGHHPKIRESSPAPRAADDARFLLMRRLLIAMLIIAGAGMALGLAPVQATNGDRNLMLAFGAVLGAQAVVFLAWRRAPAVLYPASWMLSNLMISGVIATADPIGGAPFYYVWPAVLSAYFASQRTLVLTLLMTAVTLPIALAINPVNPNPGLLAVDTVTMIVLMSGLIALMHRRERRLRGRLARAAQTDALTGLLNRRAYNPQLAEAVQKAESAGEALSVVMFDIDHFKRFNDSLGHQAGDDALVAMASVLSRQSREDDLVCRFGGEEFAVALPGANADGALSYTNRVARALQATSTPLPLSASAGIATITKEVRTPSDLTDLADQALYAAKEGGRARAARWTDGGIVVGEPTPLADATPAATATGPRRLVDRVPAPGPAETHRGRLARLHGRLDRAITNLEGAGGETMMRRIVALMLLMEGIASGATAYLGVSPDGRSWPAVVGLVFVVASAVVATVPLRAPALKALLAATIVGLSLVLATAQPVGITPGLFLWPVVLAAYFGSRRLVGGIVGLMVVAVTIALAVNTAQEVRPVIWMATTFTVAIMATLVHLLVAQQSQLHKQLADAALTDPLTGLRNRRSLGTSLVAAIENSLRRGTDLSVVMFDLDHFKSFNDRFGHLGGDEALRRMARILVAEASDTDVVARYGGEEFAVVLDGSDGLSALWFAERISVALLREPVAPEHRLTTSAGIAECDTGCADPQLLIARADGALYAAKEGGRARAARHDGLKVIVGTPVDPSAAAPATPPLEPSIDQGTSSPHQLRGAA